MSFWPAEGGAWACKINAHRHSWNGEICRDPCRWNCGADFNFREDFCDQGDARCFHVGAFGPTPLVGVDEKGIGWLLEQDPHSLDGQVLFLYANQGKEPNGMVNNGRFQIAGIYVVDRVTVVELPFRNFYQIHPKAGQAFAFEDLGIPTPRWSSVGGRPYMMHFDAGAVDTILRGLQEGLDRKPSNANQARSSFLSGLRTQLGASSKANEERRIAQKLKSMPVPDFFENPFKELQSLVKPAEKTKKLSSKNSGKNTVKTPAAPAPAPVEPQVEATQPEHVTPEPAPTAPLKPAPLHSLNKLKEHAAAFNDDVVRALWLSGHRPNSLTILRGSPGIGKSYFATQSTPADRRCVVAVSSTWRGHEDLLGYTSPVTYQFQPTEFTEFLRQAEIAWKSGDTAPFVVVFEEFNLSPPEFWFSDILVRSQFPIDHDHDRTIVLGGKAPASWNGDGEARVYLSPSVHFIGTVNTDHTTRILSPRVLDRATLIHFELSPEQMLDQVKVQLEKDQIEAIKGLHHGLCSRGVTFSIRTASAIGDAIEHQQELGINTWQVLDLILCTQLLSKVRLNSGAPGDLDIITSLADDWSSRWGKNLPLCVGRFEAWRELLLQGFDVVQA